MTATVARYQRIAPFYDILDFPFETRRYRVLRPLLFQGLSGQLLDAGIGTGRNCAFYPPEATVSGIDVSPAMLAIARRRCPILSAAGRLHRMDVTELDFPAGTFDAAVATFLFCVLPDRSQVPGLRELGRVVKPGGQIRLWNTFARAAPCDGYYPRLGNHGSSWAYGASFDRETEKHIPEAGLELIESRYVVDDLVKLLVARSPQRLDRS